MKILIVGLGSIGHKHYKNLCLMGEDDVDIVEPNIINQTGLSFKMRNRYKDIGEVPTLSYYDLIIIATPSETHESIVRYCCEKQAKYLMVEKPFYTIPTEYELALNSGLKPVIRLINTKIFINYPYLFDRGIIKLKECLGMVGKIKMASFENAWGFGDCHPTRKLENFEGVIYDDIHIISTVRFLLGDITTILSSFHSPLVFQFNAFCNSIFTCVCSSLLGGSYKKRIEVRGDKGTLVWNYLDHELFFTPTGQNERIAIAYQKCDHLYESLKYVVDTVKARAEFGINTIEEAEKDMSIVRRILCE